MVGIILGIIVTLGCVGFSIWYIYRTPSNLRVWYGLPIIIFNIVILALCWSLVYSNLL